MYSLLYRVSETCKLFGLFSELNVSLIHTHLSPHSNLPPQLRALAAILCSRYLYLYMRTEIWGIKDKHFPVRCPPRLLSQFRTLDGARQCLHDGQRQNAFSLHFVSWSPFKPFLYVVF